jgi:DNA-binding IclR family transcriptional regulator
MVGNAFRVLEAFCAVDGELGLQQVASRTGITKSSAFRILLTLEELGYLDRNAETGRYRLGRRLFESAARARGRRGIVQVAQPHMRALHARFGETVNLGGLQGGQVVYLETVEGSYAFRLSTSVGQVAPMHASALGKAILAFQPEEIVRALLPPGRLPRLTGRTIVGRGRLLASLERIRQQGYAFDDEEVEPMASCVAAPILGAEGRALHALSVSGPTHRIAARRRAIIAEVTAACATISRALGDGP